MSRKREPPCKRAANHNFCYRDRLCPGVLGTVAAPGLTSLLGRALLGDSEPVQTRRRRISQRVKERHFSRPSTWTRSETTRNGSAPDDKKLPGSGNALQAVIASIIELDA